MPFMEVNIDILYIVHVQDAQLVGCSIYKTGIEDYVKEMPFTMQSTVNIYTGVR